MPVVEKKVSIPTAAALCVALVTGSWTIASFVYGRHWSHIASNTEKILFVREIQVEVTTLLGAIRDDIDELKSDVKLIVNRE